MNWWRSSFIKIELMWTQKGRTFLKWCYEVVRSWSTTDIGLNVVRKSKGKGLSRNLILGNYSEQFFAYDAYIVNWLWSFLNLRIQEWHFNTWHAYKSFMSGEVSFTRKYQCVEINQFVAATRDGEFWDQKVLYKRWFDVTDS